MRLQCADAVLLLQPLPQGPLSRFGDTAANAGGSGWYVLPCSLCLLPSSSLPVRSSQTDIACFRAGAAWTRPLPTTPPMPLPAAHFKLPLLKPPGMLALLEDVDMPVALKTMAASGAAASFRIFLMPVDAMKTIMQARVAAAQACVLDWLVRSVTPSASVWMLMDTGRPPCGRAASLLGCLRRTLQLCPCSSATCAAALPVLVLQLNQNAQPGV